MRAWFTLGELADMGLPGLPQTRTGMAQLAKRHSWASATDPDGRPLCRRHKGRGGGYEYHYRVLPLRAQLHMALETSGRGKAGIKAPKVSITLTFDRDLADELAAGSGGPTEHAVVLSLSALSRAIDAALEQFASTPEGHPGRTEGEPGQ